MVWYIYCILLYLCVVGIRNIDCSWWEKRRGNNNLPLFIRAMSTMARQNKSHKLTEKLAKCEWRK